MENNIETRIKPNFIEMLKRVFGSRPENETQKDVSEMSDAEIEEILKKENPLLLKTYKGFNLKEEKEEVTKNSVKTENFSEIKRNDIKEKDVSEPNKQRQSGGFEIGE